MLSHAQPGARAGRLGAGGTRTRVLLAALTASSANLAMRSVWSRCDTGRLEAQMKQSPGGGDWALRKNGGSTPLTLSARVPP